MWCYFVILPEIVGNKFIGSVNSVGKFGNSLYMPLVNQLLKRFFRVDITQILSTPCTRSGNKVNDPLHVPIPPMYKSTSFQYD